jgi:hypothetical protein
MLKSFMNRIFRSRWNSTFAASRAVLTTNRWWTALMMNQCERLKFQMVFIT